MRSAETVWRYPPASGMMPNPVKTTRLLPIRAIRTIRPTNSHGKKPWKQRKLWLIKHPTHAVLSNCGEYQRNEFFEAIENMGYVAKKFYMETLDIRPTGTGTEITS